jgi:ribosome-associated protein
VALQVIDGATKVSGTRDDDPDDGADERPSKSSRKRAAHAAQDLGEVLVRLKDAELDALQLPDFLAEAIRAARLIKSRAALARQRQYIGKLMREVDPEPIRAALARRDAISAQDTELFRRLEHWRERLVSEGDGALAELARSYPGLDTASLGALVAQARHEREQRGGGASRELFRALRALFATMG